MAKQTNLERLISLHGENPRTSYYKYSKGSLMDSLDLKIPVEKIFRFELYQPEEILKKIGELDTNPNYFIEDQNTLRYFIESKEFDILRDMFQGYCGQLFGINSLFKKTYFNDEEKNTYDNYLINPSALNQIFWNCSHLYGSLKDFADLTNGSFLEDISSLETFQSLEDIRKEFDLDIYSLEEARKMEDKSLNNWASDDEQYINLEKDANDFYFQESKRHNILSKLSDLRTNAGRILTTLDYFIGVAGGFRKLIPKARAEGSEIIFPCLNTSGKRKFKVNNTLHPILFLGENKEKKKYPINLSSDEFNSGKIITGENEYGKTMATKTRGVIQIFGQARWPIIATEGEISMIEEILANIGVTENSYEGESTYKAVNDKTYNLLIKGKARSLILFDEPTGGTYNIKANTQAEIYLDGLAKSGSEFWMTTHHLSLGKYVDKYPHLQALQTEVINGEPTYRLIEGVFVPTEKNMILDYSKEMIAENMEGNLKRRFARLKKKKNLSVEELEQVEAILKSIEDQISSK